ncbi:MAG: hypothetical protein JXN63_04345 [Candidatus Delongbacteria bacterium]|nr:hypothetical protein [Candidatus Delongbacteria bacterium]
MYKFNFLAKINKEKLEQKKRDRLVSLVFFSSLICVSILLIFMYMNSLIISSDYKSFSEQKAGIEQKAGEFRKNDFFTYRNIQNVYNVVTKRKKISAVLDVIESSLDSTIVVTNFNLSENILQTVFVAKITGSRSQLMTISNNLKDRISTNLEKLGYIDEKKPVSLARFPDIKSEVNGLQYWEFKIDIEMKTDVKEIPAEEADNEDAPTELNT